MNIVMFTDSFYPELSGISDSVILLTRALAQRGHRIEIHAPHYAAREYAIARIPRHSEPEVGHGVRIVRHYSWPAPGGTGQARAALPHLLMRRPDELRPQIIHSHLCFGLGLSALQWARRLRVPALGTNHTAIAEFARYWPVGRTVVTQPLQRYWTWYYNRCQFVTAPSHSVFQEMRATGLWRSHDVVSNPIDTATLAPAATNTKSRIKREIGLTNATLVYAGRLAEEKSVDVLIRAIAFAKATVPGLMLAIAGHGQAERPLRALARELAVDDRVAFLGTLDAQALARLYQAADVFITASPSETQCLSMMQAMACALPVVGVRARALPEYILPEVGVMAEPGDAEGLARVVVALFQDPERIQALGSGARRLAERFSSTRVAAKVEQIYLDLVRQYPKGAAR